MIKEYTLFSTLMKSINYFYTFTPFLFLECNLKLVIKLKVRTDRTNLDNFLPSSKNLLLLDFTLLFFKITLLKLHSYTAN